MVNKVTKLIVLFILSISTAVSLYEKQNDLANLEKSKSEPK